VRFQEGLQVRLQERYRRLSKSDFNSYDREVGYFRDWLLKQPALHAILGAIGRSEPGVDAPAWYGSLTGAGSLAGRGYEWPTSETGRAKLVWWMLNQIADGRIEADQASFHFSSHTNLNEMLRDLTDQAVEPLVEYLQERIGSESDMLHLLERYRRRVAWFEQDRLFAAYQRDTRHGEEIYDQDLRRFLFEQGIDYPFSQPVSPSGRVDVAAETGSDDPLTCEVKLFDNGRYGPSYLAQGVAQVVRYAEDYGKTEAHLVIFNLSDRPLDLPTDDDLKQWPPRLHFAGVTAFLIVVQAGPRAKASKAGRSQPVTIRREQLIDIEQAE
jgi:hypothetical protein